MLHLPRRISLAVGLAIGFSFSVVNRDGARLTRAAAPPARKANIIRDIPYAKAADPKNPQRQTLDLYLPETAVRKPPLLSLFTAVSGLFRTTNIKSVPRSRMPYCRAASRSRSSAIALRRHPYIRARRRT
jgi:hypothetical protein